MNVQTADKLVQLRKEKGLSQEELAEKLGISRQAVSKWERAEASPDTDNLVTLAKLYGISLDDLLGNEIEQSEEERKYSRSQGNESKKRINIRLKGVHVEDGEDYVHVGWDGIHVHDKKGNNVDVKDGTVKVDDKEYEFDMKRRWYVFPVPFIVTLAYILLGVLGNMWHPYWLIFFIVPIYYSLVSAIEHRQFSRFAYPVLIAGLYLWFGFTAGAWHPNWIMFLTVPLYYMIFPDRHKHCDEDWKSNWLKEKNCGCGDCDECSECGDAGDKDDNND